MGLGLELGPPAPGLPQGAEAAPPGPAPIRTPLPSFIAPGGPLQPPCPAEGRRVQHCSWGRSGCAPRACCYNPRCNPMLPFSPPVQHSLCSRAGFLPGFLVGPFPGDPA